MKLSLIIEAIAKGRGIEQTRKAMNGLDRDARRSALGLRKADGEIIRAARSARRLEQAGVRIGEGIGRGTRRAIGGLMALERRLTITNAQAAKLGMWGGRQIGGGLRVGATVAAGGLLAAGWKVGSAGITFENLNAQMEVVEGSAAKAEKSMAWITKFAAQTPYELEQVSDAFIFARNSGIDPMTGSLRILGDASAAMRQELGDAIEMIADAQNFEFQRTRGFGITASQRGNQVAFSYFTKAGKAAVRTVRKDAQSIQNALLGILDEKFAGNMQRRSQTTEGKWRNLMDRLTVSANRVWEGGVGPAANRTLDQIEGRLSKLEENGSLERTTSNIGKGVGQIIDAMRTGDWKDVGKDIGDLGREFEDLGAGIRAAQSAGDGLTWLSKKLQEVGKNMYYWRMLANPGAALANGYIPNPFAGSPDAPKPGPARPAPRPATPYNGPFLKGPPAGFPARPTPKHTPLIGKISLDVRTDRGTTVTPTKLTADKGLGIQLNTGRAMAGRSA